MRPEVRWEAVTGVCESIVSNCPSGSGAELRPKTKTVLISADRLCWDFRAQVTTNSSPFRPEKRRHCTPQSKKWGYRYPLCRRKLRLWKFVAVVYLHDGAFNASCLITAVNNCLFVQTMMPEGERAASSVKSRDLIVNTSTQQQHPAHSKSHRHWCGTFL